MSFALYGDENAQHDDLGEMLSAVDVDWLTTEAAGNAGLSDQAQLEFATAQGRAVLTFDKADFQRLHAEWARAGREHAGIIICTFARLPSPVLFAEMMRLQAVYTPETIRNALLFIKVPPPPR